MLVFDQVFKQDPFDRNLIGFFFLSIINEENDVYLFYSLARLFKSLSNQSLKCNIHTQP